MFNQTITLHEMLALSNKLYKLHEKDWMAKLLLDPDKTFDKLLKIWNTKKKFRILNSPLVSDSDHK